MLKVTFFWSYVICLFLKPENNPTVANFICNLTSEQTKSQIFLCLYCQYCLSRKKLLILWKAL